MAQRRAPRWIGITLLLLAVVGVAIALTAVLTSLPPPPVGGTCGPGRGAESAIAAFFNPGSIGAGREPAGNSVAHLQWYAFVGQCQASTNSRMMIGLAVLVLALLIAVAGWLVLRRSMASAATEPGPSDPGRDDLEPWPGTSGTGAAATSEAPAARPESVHTPEGDVARTPGAAPETGAGDDERGGDVGGGRPPERSPAPEVVSPGLD